MRTKVGKTTLDVNRKADDSGSGSQQPEDVAAQKQATLVQRLQAVVDSGIVESFNNWCKTAGVSRDVVSTFLRRSRDSPKSDIGFRTLTALADAAGLSRQWLFVGTTLTPEKIGSEDRIVRSLLTVIDAIVGMPKEGASEAENQRALADAVTTSVAKKAVDERARCIQFARLLFEAGRIDTKAGWISVIDRLSEYDLVHATATGDEVIKNRIASNRPAREHDDEPSPDQVFEPKPTPVTVIGPASKPDVKQLTPDDKPKKNTEQRSKKGRARE
jgi:hypothetical protein